MSSSPVNSQHEELPVKQALNALSGREEKGDFGLCARVLKHGYVRVSLYLAGLQPLWEVP
jgi:hypothetical protein